MVEGFSLLVNYRDTSPDGDIRTSLGLSPVENAWYKPDAWQTLLLNNAQADRSPP